MSRRIPFTAFFLFLGATALAVALARDPEAAAKKEGRDPATSGKAGARLDKAVLPDPIEKLQLSDDQQKQVRQLIDKYNDEIDGVWKDFSKQYLDTIALEANLLAAVEDQLDDAQRAFIRKQRGRTAHAGASEARNNRAGNRQDRDARPERRDPQPGGAVEDVLIAGVTLTPEQERSADAVYAAYFERLRNGKRGIHELHTRILALESEKIAAIEQVLTKDQLAQLRKDRQPATDGSTSETNHSNDK